MNIPDVLDDHCASYRAVRVAEKKFEQRIFLELQIDELSCAPYLSHCGIHFEVGKAKAAIFLRTAPEQGTDSRRELRDGKRLDQVVISPGIETCDLGFDSAFVAEHE